MQQYSHAQNIDHYKGKIYIFDAYEVGVECDALGGNTGASTTMLKGAMFSVERVPDATHLVIRFLKWKKDQTKVSKYNLKASGERVFFLLTKAIFDASCSEHQLVPAWDINFGSMTTPFKFRSHPFLFTTNLNLGTSVAFQKKFEKSWSWGIIGGLSLSSVSLDSFSTKGIVKNVTERPAVTPSFHGMIGYKNINITIGLGWDFINRTSSIEEIWIYHGKRWIGIGIGVSLFNANSNAQGTEALNQK